MEEKKKKWYRYPLLVAFAAFIWGFALLDMLLPAREYSEMENRYLTQAPDISLRGVINNTYTLRYEEYVNDQFAGRDVWITVKSLCETALGKLENNGIVYGADGYMFEKVTVLDTAQLEKNAGFVADFAARHPEQNIVFSVIPNSYAVLGDKLPDGLPMVDQLALIDDIYAGMDGLPLALLDLTPALAARDDEYIYYRTDHHWTTLGAYYGYAAFMEQLGREPAPLDALPAHEVDDFLGTYYSKAKLWDAVADTITWYDVPVGEVVVDGEAVDGLYDLDQFGERDKYAAFIHSNNALTVIRGEGQDTAAPSRVLLVKDSYGNSIAPFLACSFDEVYVVDLRYYNDLEQLLADTEFDAVYVLYNFSTLTTDLHVYKLASGE